MPRATRLTPAALANIDPPDRRGVDPRVIGPSDQAWEKIFLPSLGEERSGRKPAGAALATGFFADADAASLFAALHGELVWEEREIKLFGRRMMQPRLVAFYGDSGAAYSYSGTLFSPRPWTSVLCNVRREVEALVGRSFNAVLCNLYRSGADSMGWHSDDEPELGESPVIASVSFGATRRLRFRARDRAISRASTGIDLKAGSVLLMTGAMQQLYQHQIPKVAASVEVLPRINLTFRQIGDRCSAAGPVR